MQHEFAAVKLETGRQRRLRVGGHVFQAQHLAATVAVEVRVAVLVAAPDLEAPGALTGRDALRDVLVDEPFERAIERDTVVAMPASVSATPTSSWDSGCAALCKASMTATRVRVTRPPCAAISSLAVVAGKSAGAGLGEAGAGMTEWRPFEF